MTCTITEYLRENEYALKDNEALRDALYRQFARKAMKRIRQRFAKKGSSHE